MSTIDDIFNIFNSRAQEIEGHDPWRYGEDLSLMTDEIEFQWLIENFPIDENDIIIDVGCGTGRHVLLLAENNPGANIVGCDFIGKNVEFLQSEITNKELRNVTAVNCNGTDFSEHVGFETCSKIIAIGLVQYLTSEEELLAFANCCDELLESGSSLIMKHPLACVESFTLDYTREEMKTRYIARYYDLNELMRPFLGRFELMRIERTFTEENVGEILPLIERDERARQMWIHLEKK